MPNRLISPSIGTVCVLYERLFDAPSFQNVRIA